MTGHDIKRLRERIGLTAQQFADIFGVHQSTVYRWESAARSLVEIEPLQEKLLLCLGDITRGRTDAELSALYGSLEIALRLGGPLRAIYELLGMVYKERPIGKAVARATSAAS